MRWIAGSLAVALALVGSGAAEERDTSVPYQNSKVRKLVQKLARAKYDSTYGKTLLIGDSHTWFARANPANYQGYTVDAEPGRDSTEGVEALRNGLRPRYRRVIFDLGTNDGDDPQAFLRNLRRARRMTKARQLDLVTTYREDGNPSEPVNRVIRRFVRNHPRVGLVPWAREAKANPEYMGEDKVHYTSEGYDQRARAVENAPPSRYERRLKRKLNRVLRRYGAAFRAKNLLNAKPRRLRRASRTGLYY